MPNSTTAAPQIPMAKIILANPIGDWVGSGGANAVGESVVAAESVPDTSVIPPACTFTDDCQSRYPFIFSMMAWFPGIISLIVSGVRPRYALSMYMLAPEGLDLTVIPPVVTRVVSVVPGTMTA